MDTIVAAYAAALKGGMTVRLLAIDTGTTASEVVRKALTLYIIATEKKQQGLRLGFARPDQILETEVIGL